MEAGVDFKSQWLEGHKQKHTMKNSEKHSHREKEVGDKKDSSVETVNIREMQSNVEYLQGDLGHLWLCVQVKHV